MNFGKALKAMKKGKKITRRSWGGKYIYIVNGNLNYEPCKQVGMMMDSGFTEPWVVRQVDLFADDWGLHGA